MYKVIIVEDYPMVSMINHHYVEQDKRFSVVDIWYYLNFSTKIIKKVYSSHS